MDRKGSSSCNKCGIHKTITCDEEGDKKFLFWVSSQNFDVFVLQIIEGLSGFSIFASEVLKVKQFQDPEQI